MLRPRALLSQYTCFDTYSYSFLDLPSSTISETTSELEEDNQGSSMRSMLSMFGSTQRSALGSGNKQNESVRDGKSRASSD